MGGGKAVFQTVGSAGVLGHVSADGADALRGWIGRVEEAIGGDPCSEVIVDDAGLHGHALVDDADVQDLRHTCEADDDATLGGQCATREPGARAASHEGDRVACAGLNDRLHLCCGARKHHRGRNGSQRC